MTPRILTTRTLLPECFYSAAAAAEIYQRWVAGQSEAFRRKAARIFTAAAIEEKHTVVPVGELFKPRSIDESNGLYRQKAIELGSRLLKSTLKQAGLNPADLDLLITTSCTGFMIPSLDAYLIEELGLRADLRRQPITQIGCAAGVTGLVYAVDFLRAYPDKRAAVLSVEFPSNTMQPHNFSWDNVVGTAIFGDGLGCTLLGAGAKHQPAVIDVAMQQTPGTTAVLGYSLTQSGFVMNLDPRLPQLIGANFMKVLEPFLGRNGLGLADIDYFLVHPGGIKILETIAKQLSAYGKGVKLSETLMRRHGNMSSATIHFIMEDCFRQPIKGPAHAVVMSYGPGFSTHLALLHWEE